MGEYRQVFKDLLHGKLKEKIIGGIVVKIDRNDELIVEIYREHELDYWYKLNDFSIRFLHGLSTDYVVYEVMTGYRKRIMAKYFR